MFLFTPIARFRTTSIYFLWLFGACMHLCSFTACAQLFSQDFGASTTVSSYVSTTPSAGQFNAITVAGSSTVSAVGNRLAFTRGSGNCSFSRSANLSPVPGAMAYRFDLTVSGTPSGSTASTALWRVGTGFGTGNADESDANTFAKMAVDFRGTGSFRFNDLTNGATSSNFNTGTTHVVTWVLNNSGSTFTYLAPNGAAESIVNDRVDFWVGTTRIWNDVNVQSAGVNLEDLKFFYGSSTGTISLDNINIEQFVTVSAQPSSQVVCPGTVSFTVNSSPAGAGVQWQLSTDNGATWSDIVGATASTYSFSATASDNGEQFRAVLNDYILSGVATLSIPLPKAVTVSASTSAICAGQTVSLTGPSFVSGANMIFGYQNFEATGSVGLTFAAGGSGGAVRNGSSASGDRPQSSPFFVSGSNGYGATNGTATLTFSNVTGLAGLYSKRVSMRLAAFSIGSTTNGLDAGDLFTVAISLDGGTTYSDELQVTGISNAWWSFSNGTGQAIINYDGQNAATIFTPSGGGQRSSDGFSTLVINLPDAASQARVRVTMVNNSSEAWVVDDVLIEGWQPTYQWSSSPTGGASGSAQNLTGLSPASTTTYTVTATNQVGCTTASTVQVVVNPAVSLNATATPVSCHGGTNGAINLSVLTGSPTYSYAWSTSATTQHLNGLVSGTYTVTVSDSKGCTATTAATVSQPPAVVINSVLKSDYNGFNLSCAGSADGQITIMASGGSGALQYSKDNGLTYQSSHVFGGLGAGNHVIRVKDASDCSVSITVTLTAPQALTASCVSTAPNCFGANGTVVVSATGGASSYAGTGTFTVTAGTYQYTVSDQNGCIASCTASVSEPSPVSVSCVATHAICPDGNGQVVVTATGGTGPYVGTGSFQVPVGAYQYVVTDANGCASSCSGIIASENTASIAAAGIDANDTLVCIGNDVLLNVDGGQLGSGAQWQWYLAGCGSVPIGSGASLAVIPTQGQNDYFVRAEGTCGVSACAFIRIYTQSAPPLNSVTSIAAPSFGCQGDQSVLAIASVPRASVYSWSVTPACTFNGQASTYSGQDTTVGIQFGSLNGFSGYTVCVLASNECGASNPRCQWIRGSVSTPTFSTSSTVACAGSQLSYAVNPVSGATGYAWTGTGGMTISGTGNAVSVDFPSGFASGQLCASAISSCGIPSGVRCLTISSATGIPGAMTGAASVCPGASLSYSIAPVVGAQSYTWSATGGLSISANGSSATVVVPGTFASGLVCVQTTTACGVQSASRCRSVASSRVGVPGAITGDPFTGVCGMNYSYAVPSLAGVTAGYTWTLPGGANIIGSASTNAVTVQFSQASLSGTLCVRGNNACGAGPDRCVSIFGNPATPSTITGSGSVCPGALEYYSWPAVPGATAYVLTVPAGAQVIGGNTTANNYAFVSFGNQGGLITVKAQNACGSSGTRTLTTAISCRMVAQADAHGTAGLKVYPNPAPGQAFIDFDAVDDDIVRVALQDASGRVVFDRQVLCRAGRNTIGLTLEDVVPGIYTISLTGSHAYGGRAFIMVQ